ncbi:plasmid maintenance protein CcdB [Sphingomonadaceae bacterium]|jgi:toxin CcdB|uniref:CcdB family protein n=1 Tax=Sphingorhabdus sp. TaxID=1902408 RepID=UPI00273FDFB1|nr:CcdB family protein [Sphingorhabdus sp.]MCF8493445.1 CcdB family protein [Sphingomonadaceae bacterium]MCX7268105.1 CcdB family protein [Sphingomonadales bacterium]MCF8498571.1 CcdB family protein [Sphingomonadaceae bacterium]MDP4872884.1 CcdB family protein [Sphingorhabdus sp.]MDP4928033.1 CcdB family protein [Sphingorhabdus sp.]
MARFDVYKSGNARGLLLDIQSDLLDEFGSRVIVPLLPAEDMQSVSRLHPVFVINDERYIMSTHLIFAIPVDRLGAKIGSLAQEDLVITSAVDTLLSGY